MMDQGRRTETRRKENDLQKREMCEDPMGEGLSKVINVPARRKERKKPSTGPGSGGERILDKGFSKEDSKKGSGRLVKGKQNSVKRRTRTEHNIRLKTAEVRHKKKKLREIEVAGSQKKEIVIGDVLGKEKETAVRGWDRDKVHEKEMKRRKKRKGLEEGWGGRGTMPG